MRQPQALPNRVTIRGLGIRTVGRDGWSSLAFSLSQVPPSARDLPLRFLIARRNPDAEERNQDLSSQHSGGKGRQVSEIERSLVYRVSPRTARAAEKPCFKIK